MCLNLMRANDGEQDSERGAAAAAVVAGAVQTLAGLSAFSTASMTSSMASSRLGSRPLFHWNSRSSSIMRTGSPGHTVGCRGTDRKSAVSECDGIAD